MIFHENPLPADHYHEISYLIHNIYINCWLPVHMWSVMDKQVTSTPPIPENGGVVVTCINITDHLETGNQQLM